LVGHSRVDGKIDLVKFKSKLFYVCHIILHD
jgi:hypothetical protein